MAAPKALTDDWRSWLQHNRERGCALEPLLEKAVAKGFDPEQVRAVLEDEQNETSQHQLQANQQDQWIWRAMAAAPLTDSSHKPRAWRVDTAQAQLYDIPQLLSGDECRQLIDLIDAALQPSTVTRGPADYRTSRTCHLKVDHSPLVAQINRRLCELIGIPDEFSETLQGQRYDVGQYFKAHTDWFAPETDEYSKHTVRGGQRTWTVMVYLNQVEAGGETCFERIGRCFVPHPGLGLAWNNLHPNGAPNHATLHEAKPILAGQKYVLTKWCRTKRWQV